MRKFFLKVDGADISKKLVEEARRANPDSDFFVTNGDDLGETPLNTYDFVYSTIALQHIAVKSIRLEIFKAISGVLKNGGKATLQMAYSNEYPFRIKRDYILNDYRLMLWKKDNRHAAWNEDKINATGTNSACDVYINKKSLHLVKDDLEKYFRNVRFWFSDVEIMYKSLHPAASHMDYWPSHWIFMHVEK
jgi:SAM-dependent methyltransferase